ncbi:DUF1825 family protein [Gloeobacter kilaueensis]|uniref:DUF1825 domain-containing protein n=1 Tax=Gloeobacter kilaueensis (strain ATCC BAA-2537 / CCAP 1431/1 / ULC 316 / JS1) TaxID=1183438 RepID=U5QDK3_GLOK1|nr:DUF1825 family protein [Gloeobacter kilaueensis]AGY56976.1 hypothetical protein GKIL_0730 [Gloeobacter kilaueensis JS1]
MGFFDSEIVQQEAREFYQEYQELMRIGSNYGKFDREGKKLFIEKMEDLLERQRIMLKRMELSDDFMAQMAMKQMTEQLNTVGMTPQQMFQQMEKTLEEMKAQIKE